MFWVEKKKIPPTDPFFFQTYVVFFALSILSDHVLKPQTWVPNLMQTSDEPVSKKYRKLLKIQTPENSIILLKSDADGMANSVDPDQTASLV